MKEHTVDLISDWHLDRWRAKELNIAVTPTPGTRMACVAGDLDRNPELTGLALEKIAAHYETVLFVPGNNEFRDAFLTDGNFDIAPTKARITNAVARANAAFETPRIFNLEDGPFVHDGYAFVGRNGFWDHSAGMRMGLAPEQALEEQRALLENVLNKQNANGDVQQQLLKQGHTLMRAFRSVSLAEAATCMVQGARDVDEMRGEMTRLGNESDVHTLIAVSHTVPDIRLLNFPDGVSARTMSTMANLALGDLRDLRGKFNLHLYGHQHDMKDMMLDGVRYVGHPCGNPDEIYPAQQVALYKPLRVALTAPSTASAAVPGPI